MIFWIASYPKSGNTWLRALISSYYYSKDGVFNQDLLKKLINFQLKNTLMDLIMIKKLLLTHVNFGLKLKKKLMKIKKN